MSENIDYNYLELLNPQQREAVEYIDGPSLVIAGAGSGKTRVLTYKIVHLLRLGFEPYRIMALTFTNKAAREMRERITNVIGEKIASRLWMGTFHSIFLRILRRHSELLGFKPGFSIYDASDSKSLIKMIIKDMALDEKVYKASTVANIISNAKNAMVTPEIYNTDKSYYDEDRRQHRPLIGKIYEAYMNRCHLANAMDFDDILLFTNILLRDNPDIRRHYQAFFRYILVDEYQDTNFAQHLVITQLAGEEQRICVVGDDAQSIYSFRGANISNILNLHNQFKNLRIFKLERNYRSTQNIINAAGSLIEKNTRQMKKKVYSENSVGEKIKIVKNYSDLEEAHVVSGMINNMKFENHDSYEDYAVLYRTNAQSRALEEALRKKNIPYRIYGGLSFYQRKEIKDVISYFRLAVNPDDDEALRRIINFPTRGIGETTMKKLISAATANNCSIWNVISNMDSIDVAINAGTRKKLDGFHSLISMFIADNVRGADAYQVAQLIYNRTGILTNLASDNTPESVTRQENLQEMLAGLKEFVDIRNETGEGDADMQSFLSEVMLATDQDKTEDETGPKVTLMTVHAAKGLEFKHIFIVGVEEELFPSAMAMTSLSEIEEERRLLYVAITRAKDTCVILYAGTRYRNGMTMATQPSRFLLDIDRKFLDLRTSNDLEKGYFKPSPTSAYSADYHSRQKPLYYKNGDNNYKNFSGKGNNDTRFIGSENPQREGRKLRRISNMANLKSANEPEFINKVKVGTVIEHQRFGRGVIRDITMMSDEKVIVVDFGAVGVKKLLLRFAKFNIIT